MEIAFDECRVPIDESILWGEGKGATRKARLYIGGMFLCYLAAIVCLAESSHKGELAETLVDLGLENATVLESEGD